MKQSEHAKLLEIVKSTAEIYGKTVSVASAVMFLADLDGYPPSAIVEALSKCRKELRTFPSVADVIARISDGRPGVEEAWAMIPKDEYASVVWSNEMAEAYGVARGLLDEDPIAARMAFKETYLTAIARGRASGRPPKWTPSLGFDPHGRELAIREAIEKNRMTLASAQVLLPEVAFVPETTPALDQGPRVDVLEILPKMPSNEI